MDANIFDAEIKGCSHFSKANLYCQKCRILICDICKGEHKNHLNNLISYNSFLTLINFQIDLVNENVETTIDTITNCFKKIDEKFEELINNLKEQKIKFYEEIQKNFKIEYCIDKLLTISNSVKNYSKCFKNDSESQERKKIIEKLNEILKTKILNEINEIKKVDYDLDTNFSKFNIDNEIFKNCFESEVIVKCCTKKGNFFYYSGEHLNEVPNGNGIMSVGNGLDNYFGEFKNGLRSGHGIYIFGESRKNLGDKYIGEFENDYFQGNGKHYDKNGQLTNEGIFLDGEFIKK